MKSSKREIMLNALLTHATVKMAAKSTGISESTYFNWLNKPDFKDELDRRRAELVVDVKNHLQSRLMDTVNVVFTIMNDSEAPAQVRLNAASEAFRNTIKLIEQSDILDRLDALEEAQKDENRI